MSGFDLKVMNAWFAVVFAYSCWREFRDQQRHENAE